MSAGQPIASQIALSASQLSVMPVGLPKRSRTAVAVAEMGFHSVMAASHAGIVSGATSAFDAKPTGHTSTCTAVVALVPRKVRPRKIPSQTSE